LAESMEAITNKGFVDRAVSMDFAEPSKGWDSVVSMEDTDIGVRTSQSGDYNCFD
jgi:hypothetical protein